MAEIDGHWLEPSYGDVYHGKADGSGGPVWVFPLVHSGAGLHVEVRAGVPDGPVIRRTAVVNMWEARVLVQQMRNLMLRSGYEAVLGQVDRLVPRGSCIVHAVPWGRKYQHAAAAMRGGPAAYLCQQFWALPGTYQVVAGYLAPGKDSPERVIHEGSAEMTVQIQAYATVELRIRWLWANRLLFGRPWIHGCKVEGMPPSTR
jgi:hypothetical protein